MAAATEKKQDQKMETVPTFTDEQKAEARRAGMNVEVYWGLRTDDARKSAQIRAAFNREIDRNTGDNVSQATKLVNAIYKDKGKVPKKAAEKAMKAAKPGEPVIAERAGVMVSDLKSEVQKAKEAIIKEMETRLTDIDLLSTRGTDPMPKAYGFPEGTTYADAIGTGLIGTLSAASVWQQLRNGRNAEDKA